MSKPVTFDHLRSAKKPATRSVRIAMDSDLAERHVEAKNRVTTTEFAANGAPPEREAQAKRDLAKARKELTEAEEAIREASVKFTFRTIGRKRFEQLVEEYPATDKQREQNAEVDWDAEKFPPALIAAALVEPELTPEQVQEIWDSDDWSSGDLEQLFLSALMVNRSRTVVELGNA